ncbi:hypothetical protein C475_02974 [Halosimplex carlsbadense 2-9-1]|uniref:DUF3887 domain-containing protein n=1 Tax=Halosimplex carlsbadense 2-9-1 TaxID=797114 RepID=M0D126_9EURY|nr:DUF3887 domain-containing protein [Halosimplex carlsbadense]ELZ29145.1 hypothetical protein C475_02974 [Halosimplex carlsbadense 2-9-1]
MQPDPDPSPDASRRRLLRSVAGLAAVGALAGCNEGADGTDGSPTPAETDTPAPSPTPSAPATPSPTVAPTTAPPTAPPTATPTPSPTATVTSTPTEPAVAREFLAHLRAGEFDAAHAMFTPDLASAVTRPTLERYWLGLQAQHGAVRSVGSVETTTDRGSDVALVPVECAQGSARIEVAGAGGGRIGGLWFSGEYSAPEYVDDAAFTERTLTLEPEGCSLPATLTVPAGASGGGTATATATDSGTVPGVVLVHGSGPHDRDETIGPNKPFRDIAQGLATRGVAVLRYEKRTYACDVSRAEWAIDDIVVDDAVHALGVLRDQPEVDPERSAVAGHSLGAACVPRIAERDGRVAGGAVLAGNARPFTEVYPGQVRHIFEVQGGLSAREEQQLAAVTQLMSAVEDGSVADDRPIGPLPGIWWKTFYEYDQVATANRIDADLLFAHGGRDFQIPIDPAMTGWREGIDDADAHRFERYPDLSHLFQPGAEPSLQTEYLFADSVARDLVTDLADWTTGL